MKRRVAFHLSVGAIAVLLVGAMARPATQTERRPTGQQIDAKAVAVLQAMDDAFARAEGLVATYRSEIFRPNNQTASVESVALRLSRPNVYHVETSSGGGTRRQIFASDGTTRFAVTAGSPGRCTTWKVAPRNNSREVDNFNPVYWSFYDLGEWQIRSALAGHWVTKWRLNDPGLRSVRYVGSERAPDNVLVDVVEWTYTIGYNRPGDDPLYTSRLWIGPDHFARRIETTSTTKQEYEGRRIIETVSDIRTMARPAKDAFAYRPPEGTACREVNPEESYMTGRFADLAVGSKAPDFTLKTSRGETVRLSTFLSQHKIVVMNYWGYG